MSAIYTNGIYKIITAEQVVAGAMYVNKKLEVTFKEVNKMRDYFNSKLKETQTGGYAQWDSESIKEIRMKDKSFFVGENFVNCTAGWKKVEDIISCYDLQLLNFLLVYKDDVRSKKQKSLEK